MSDTETETTQPDPAAEPVTGLDDGGKRALDAERGARRAADKALKEATAELAALRAKSLTDQERAVLEAHQAGKAEALGEMGGRMVGAEFRAAAAGLIPPPALERLLAALDPKPFVDAAGQPNLVAIKEFVEGIAPARDPGVLDLGQGARGGEHQALSGDPLLRDLKAHLGIR